MRCVSFCCSYASFSFKAFKSPFFRVQCLQPEFSVFLLSGCNMRCVGVFGIFARQQFMSATLHQKLQSKAEIDIFISILALCAWIHLFSCFDNERLGNSRGVCCIFSDWSLQKRKKKEKKQKKKRNKKYYIYYNILFLVSFFLSLLYFSFWLLFLFLSFLFFLIFAQTILRHSLTR